MMFQPLKAKVTPPNYEFKLESLNDFLPEKKMSDLEVSFGKGKEVRDLNGVKTFQYQVKKEKYHISVLVQEKDGVIIDSFFRLPSYFLHDVFFQSLINKLGKQSSYKKVGEEAHYIWKLEKEVHVYSAACTITCFPIFYSVKQSASEVPSILEQLGPMKQMK